MSAGVYPILASGIINTITNAMQAEAVEEWSAETVEAAISLCHQARRAVKDIRHEQEMLLEGGMQAKAFVAQIEPRAQMIGRGLAVLSRLVEGNGGRALAPRLQDFLSESQALVREATDLQNFLLEALAKAKAPPRPIDWNRVQEAERAYARGQTKPFEIHPKAGAKE